MRVQSVALPIPYRSFRLSIHGGRGGEGRESASGSVIPRAFKIISCKCSDTYEHILKMKLWLWKEGGKEPPPPSLPPPVTDKSWNWWKGRMAGMGDFCLVV